MQELSEATLLKEIARLRRIKESVDAAKPTKSCNHVYRSNWLWDEAEAKKHRPVIVIQR